MTTEPECPWTKTQGRDDRPRPRITTASEKEEKSQQRKRRKTKKELSASHSQLGSPIFASVEERRKKCASEKKEKPGFLGACA